MQKIIVNKRKLEEAWLLAARVFLQLFLYEFLQPETFVALDFQNI